MNDLLNIIEDYLSETGQSPTAFGKQVMNNPNFVFDLREGRDYRQSTARKVIGHIQRAQDQGDAA